MLIRYLEYKDIDNMDPEEAKFVKGEKIEEFDKFYNMLNQAQFGVKHSLQIEIDNEWYWVEDFRYSVLVDSDHISCINVYMIKE